MYLPWFVIGDGECYIEDICASCPKENENKKNAIQLLQSKHGREGIQDVSHISKQSK